MAKRERYFVSPKEGEWKVSREHSADERGFRTKSDAIDYGRRLAQDNQPSQLIVRKHNGAFEEERTYGGWDPFPPEG